MNPTEDDELRERFLELQAEDRATVPAFHALWDGAAAQADGRSRPRGQIALWIAAAAAAVVLVAGTLARRAGDRDPVPSISTWTSPTASLLRTSGRELFAPPSILSSTLDGGAPGAVHLKGDQP